MEYAEDRARLCELPCSAADAVRVSEAEVCDWMTHVHTAVSFVSAQPGLSDSCPQYCHQAEDQRPTPLLNRLRRHHSMCVQLQQNKLLHIF